MDYPQVDQEKFWSRFDRSGGADACWVWRGARAGFGYGRFYHGRKFYMAHRIAMILEHGPIPNELCVLHHCDNPPCCNPSHLFLGSKTDNMRDKVAKGRQAKGDMAGLRLHPERRAYGDRNASRKYPERRPRGEKMTQAKLKDCDIPIIRQMRRDGVTQKAVAQHFGVSKSVINHIDNGRRWKHIP